MLRILRGGQRWLTALFVIGIGAVFVLFLGLQGPMDLSRSGGTLVMVGPYQFDAYDFERVRQRRVEQLGDLGDQLERPEVRASLDNLAVQELIDTSLLALAAQDLGLTVSNREIEQLWLNVPDLRDEAGRFRREDFEYFVEDQWGSQRAFLEDQRRALLSNKMLWLMGRQNQVSPGEAREALRRELEEVRVGLLVVDPPASEAEVTDEEVARLLEERPADVRALFAERASEFDRPERVRVRHILISVAVDAPQGDADAALARLEAARARLEAGESFETVAEDVSEDPGSALSGGDVGFFARGQMVPEFEEAAFAIEPGELSEPVRSPFGWHLIRGEEREDALLVPYEDAREQLARSLLAAEAAREAARARGEELAARAAAGEDLETLARSEGLHVSRSGWLRRDNPGGVPGLGPAPELLAAAFALEPGQSADRLFQVGDRAVLIETLEKRPADPDSIEQRLEARRQTLLEAKRDARLTAWIDEHRSRLLDAGELQVDLSPIRGS